MVEKTRELGRTLGKVRGGGGPERPEDHARLDKKAGKLGSLAANSDFLGR